MITYDNEATARAVAFIYALDDEAILEAAREATPWHPKSQGFQIIADRMDGDTNPLWIVARAATAAYDRGLIDEHELDWLTR